MSAPEFRVGREDGGQDGERSTMFGLKACGRVGMTEGGERG